MTFLLMCKNIPSLCQGHFQVWGGGFWLVSEPPHSLWAGGGHTQPWGLLFPQSAAPPAPPIS